MAPMPEFGGCTANSQLKVLATGTKVINAQTLKYLVVDFCNPDLTSQGFQDTIIEKIGFTGSYMLPFDMCTMAFDGNEGGPFRCYSDDNFSTYKPFYANDCEFLVGLEENQMHELAIYPNPSAGQLYIESELPLENIQLTDAIGRTIQSFDLQAGVNQMRFSSFHPGTYFIRKDGQCVKWVVE